MPRPRLASVAVAGVVVGTVWIAGGTLIDLDAPEIGGPVHVRRTPTEAPTTAGEVSSDPLPSLGTTQSSGDPPPADGTRDGDSWSDTDEGDDGADDSDDEREPVQDADGDAVERPAGTTTEGSRR